MEGEALPTRAGAALPGRGTDRDTPVDGPDPAPIGGAATPHDPPVGDAQVMRDASPTEVEGREAATTGSGAPDRATAIVASASVIAPIERPPWVDQQRAPNAARRATDSAGSPTRPLGAPPPASASMAEIGRVLSRSAMVGVVLGLVVYRGSVRRARRRRVR